ncbi:MAG: hypothetical protein AVDCRST_MAG79-520 [uncultured Thermoleophilia bacterium]|uniref:DUF3052 domain-containing protein n=1 Tax=uncultured Thermoleophilia bacterium TaxID=1497501 RepID=A0A6J4TK56_9ACTN|nr:MAG: hypothetical protein AVDCRST_MAG79-520 [uncultured Thermoleophilia bacterium]
MGRRPDSSPAGYSGTPLPHKLGLEPGMTATWLDAPADFASTLGELPGEVELRDGLDGHLDLVVCFVTERDVLAERLEPLREAIRPAGMAWIAWPKRASKVPTTVTEDVVRELALPLGLVDVKVCAIDAVWSGLKLVLRRELR